jgi:hypothetical protein
MTENTAPTPAKIGWDSLFLNGSVVDLDISIWTARTGIKAADLGIENTDEVHKALSLGCHRLAPKAAFDEIREIASQAKRTVEFYSLNFSFVRGARYVPEKRMEPLLQKLRDIKGRFDQAADRFSQEENYGTVRAEMLPIMRKALEDATRNPALVESAYNRVLAEYPTSAEVRSRFALAWSVYAIRGATTEAAAEAAEQETSAAKGIIRGMVEQLRGEFTERCGAIMAAIAKGGKIPQGTLEAAKETLTRIDSMNIFGDAELYKQTAALRNIIGKAEANSGKMFSGGVLAELATIQTSINTSVEQAVRDAENNLTQMGRRKLDLSAAPAPAEA